MATEEPDSDTEKPDHFTGLTVSEIKGPSASPKTIHGVITTLSPVKESNRKVKYFDGTVSDDTDSKRFVSFNTDLFTSMKESKDKCHSIRIDKCVVKRSSLNENLEVIVNDKTRIIQSPKKFKVDQSLIVEPDKVLLSNH